MVVCRYFSVENRLLRKRIRNFFLKPHRRLRLESFLREEIISFLILKKKSSISVRGFKSFSIFSFHFDSYDFFSFCLFFSCLFLWNWAEAADHPASDAVGAPSGQLKAQTWARLGLPPAWPHEQLRPRIAPGETPLSSTNANLLAKDERVFRQPLRRARPSETRRPSVPPAIKSTHHD